MFNNALDSQHLSRTAGQLIRHTLQSWSFYTTACLAVGLSTLLIFSTIHLVSESRPSIIAQPFIRPLEIVLAVAILYGAIRVALSVSLPRKAGSLQLGFWPSNNGSVLVGGSFLAGLSVYIFFVLLTLPSLWLLALETNFIFPHGLLLAIIPTLFVVSAVNAFAIFVSAAFPSGRVAVLVFIASVLAGTLIQLGWQAADETFLTVSQTTPFYDAVVHIHTILATLKPLFSWISPFRMLDIVVNSSLVGDRLPLLQQSGSALFATVFWLYAAGQVWRRRGAIS